MTSPLTEGDDLPAPRLQWWREIVYILAFYGVYTAIRNRGLDVDGKAQAFTNAKRVITAERFVGLFHEETIQEWFLSQRWFIQFWNIFYGTFHFVVTVLALVWMFRAAKRRYPLWRNTLAFTTGLALFGFAFFPLMPPRLLPDSYGFVDTLKVFGGLWSFDSGAMEKISNQYAAMPSLHFAWSSWSACVLVPLLRPRWAKGLLIAYPFVTLFAIIVTGNHFWLDAAGGALVLLVGHLVARWFTRWMAERGTGRSRDAETVSP